MLPTALFFLGMTRANLGHISNAVSTLNEALKMAQRNADAIHLVRVPNGIRWIYREVQNFNVVPMDRDLQPEASIPHGSPQSQIDLIHEVTRSSQLEETREHKREAEAIYDRNPWMAFHFSGVRVQAGAAEYSLSQGDLDTAAERARELLENSTRHGPPKYVVVAHKLLAEIAMARNELPLAERELSAAVEVFRTHPAPLTEWKTYATFGRLHVLMQRPEAARQAFSRAVEIVQRIASTIDDEGLRTTFQDSPAVQEILHAYDELRHPTA